MYVCVLCDVCVWCVCNVEDVCVHRRVTVMAGWERRGRAGTREMLM